MRRLNIFLWVIAALLFFWVVLQFTAPANATAKELLDWVNELLAAVERFGLRIMRLFWSP